MGSIRENPERTSSSDCDDGNGADGSVCNVYAIFRQPNDDGERAHGVLMFTITIIAAYLILWSNMAFAGNDTPGIDWREHNQKHRIFDGIQNSSLSFRETGQLLRGQARVHQMERRAQRDGIVTKRERARIHHQQNRQSRRIYRKKHH